MEQPRGPELCLGVFLLQNGCPEKKDTQKFTSRSGTHVPIFFKLFTSIV